MWSLSGPGKGCYYPLRREKRQGQLREGTASVLWPDCWQVAELGLEPGLLNAGQAPFPLHLGVYVYM